VIRLSARTGILAGLAFLVTGVQAEAQWKPPLGIPAPSFGVQESHQMFAGRTFDFGVGPEPYRDAGNGPFTHYIDNTSLAATDTANPYGTPARPRLTFPGNLAAGSVVELHGGPYNFRNLSDKMAVWGAGTASAPIFLRGASPTDMAVLTKDLMVMGSYVVVENLMFDKARISVRQDLLGQAIDHISIRHLEMHGTGVETGNAEAISIGRWGVTSPSSISDVVVFANNLHDFGSRQQDLEADWIGVSVSGYDCYRTWILDNDIYRFGGDSIRVGNNDGWAIPASSRYAYIGRNRLHDNGENALDVKVMQDIVASQNVMYGFRPSSSDPGTAIVVHYNPANVWLLFNEIYNAPGGVFSSGVVDLHIVGNIIRDVTEGIKFWGGGELHIVGNTMTRVGSGVVNIGGVTTGKHLINNIITNLIDATTGYHIRYNLAGLALSSAMDHNLLYQNNGQVRIDWGGRLYTSVASFLTGSGKGLGSLEGDPRFVDAAANNLRLAVDSPAIDRGTETSYADTFKLRFGQDIDFDIAGIRRSVGITDIGAHERSSFGPASPPSNLRIQ
jgi:hypothetical protein